MVYDQLKSLKDVQEVEDESFRDGVLTVRVKTYLEARQLGALLEQTVPAISVHSATPSGSPDKQIEAMHQGARR